MKSTTASSLLALAAASTVSAQAPTYTNQSAPFSLQIANSANASLNGLYLYACHAGAAIEGLCLGATSDSFSTFYYNTTDTDVAGSDDGQGLLVWNLPITGLPGIDHESQSASLTSNHLGTNVVVPLFGLGDGTPVHFTDDGKLTIEDYYNDANFVAGQFPSTTTLTVYNNWYVCWTDVGTGYTYQALAWVTAGEPHDPTCQKVDVVRTAL
jgi:hypothetical protein